MVENGLKLLQSLSTSLKLLRVIILFKNNIIHLFIWDLTIRRDFVYGICFFQKDLLMRWIFIIFNDITILLLTHYIASDWLKP